MKSCRADRTPITMFFNKPYIVFVQCSMKIGVNVFENVIVSRYCHGRAHLFINSTAIKELSVLRYVVPGSVSCR